MPAAKGSAHTTLGPKKTNKPEYNSASQPHTAKTKDFSNGIVSCLRYYENCKEVKIYIFSRAILQNKDFNTFEQDHSSTSTYSKKYVLFFKCPVHSDFENILYS
jgi:hypothetical protein